MSRLTRDGTAEPVSRDQILRHERGQGTIHFTCSADHEQDRQPYPVDPSSCYMCDHTYIQNAGVPIVTTRVSFFSFSFCLFGDVAFSEHYFFCTISVFSLCGEYAVRSFLTDDGVFL